MSDPSGFPSGVYPQPIGSFTGGASSSTTSSASLLHPGTTSTLPTATTYVGGQQFPAVSASGITNLAAAAAAAAAISSPKKGATAGGAAATKTGKRPYKKSGATSKRGGGSGGGRGGAHTGGQSSRGTAGSGGGGDGDKDSDDDEDEPEVSIEEQFILRLPPGEMCDRFREKVISREIDESVNLKFRDSRRGTFKFEGLTFSTKLVDLPNIIEAQKTLNGKQMYKIADISQMLIVDSTPEPAPPGASNSANSDGNWSSLPLPPMKPSEYTWPDGLSMALKNVRRRRFRKRVSKAAVEGVENEIERLLHEDALAEEVKFEIREQAEGMDEGMEGMDQFDFSDEGVTPAPEGEGDDYEGRQNSDLDMIDDEEMMEGEEDEDEDDEEQDDMLAELEREMEREMQKGGSSDEEDGDDDNGTPKPASKPAQTSGGSGSGSSAIKSGSGGSLPNVNAMHIDIRNASGPGASSSGNVTSGAGTSRAEDKKKKVEEDDDEDDEEEDDDEEDDDEDEDDDDDDSGSDEDDDDDEDDKEKAQVEKMLKDEIKELNGKIRENQDKLNSAPNEILKKRFGSILDTLRKELELKTMQLEEIKDHSKDKKKQ
ncbi:hypothetical protein CPC16_003040 [Podila verticillata]|nr:hypothetical protein BGZ59_002207 [Podila verticillata]KAF9371470.1 hypothetical protein CPC16_003040 [Podila verticillata]KFH63807.1 hypothetical protein MVEG_10500 [Podila verticillata NRRL 6337]